MMSVSEVRITGGWVKRAVLLEGKVLEYRSWEEGVREADGLRCPFVESRVI